MVQFSCPCVAYVSSFCRLKVERKLPLCARYRSTLTRRKHQCKRVKWTPFCTIFRPFDRANDALSIGVHLVRIFLRLSCFRPLVLENDGAATVAGRCHATYSRRNTESTASRWANGGSLKRGGNCLQNGRIFFPFHVHFTENEPVQIGAPTVTDGATTPHVVPNWDRVQNRNRSLQDADFPAI